MSSATKPNIPPKGLYVPVPTFYHTPSSLTDIPKLDIETQAAHAIYLAKAGITGIVLLGSTGEGLHIHPHGRHGIISHVRQSLDQAGFHDFIVQAGTAAHNIDETVEQLIDAKDAGASYGQVLVPAYNAAVTWEEGLVHWYTAVADRSPLPIIIYNYPGVSNMLHVKATTLSKLSHHPNIVGCKLSHGDLTLISQVTLNPDVDPDHFRVFTGLGQLLWPLVTIGAAGCVEGSAGWFPKSMVRYYDLATRNDLTPEELQERKQLMFGISRVTDLIVKHGVPGIKEAIARMRGFGKVGGTRLPLWGGIRGGDAEWDDWTQ